MYVVNSVDLVLGLLLVVEAFTTFVGSFEGIFLPVFRLAFAIAIIFSAFRWSETMYGLLVSGSDDSSLRIWDAHIFELVRQFDGHSDSVHSVNFNRNGTLIISGSRDNTLRLWSADTGECTRVFKGHSDPVICAEFISDDLIISGSEDGSIKVWMMEGTKECARTIKEGITEGATSLSMNSDGTLVACATVYDSIIILGSEEWNTVRTIDERAESVCFHPSDSSVLALGLLYDHSVRLMNVSNGQLIRTLEGHNNFIRLLCFTPDGTRVISSSDDESVRLWNIEQTWFNECPLLLFTVHLFSNIAAYTAVQI